MKNLAPAVLLLVSLAASRGDACPLDTFCFAAAPGAVAGDGSATGVDMLRRSNGSRDGPLFIFFDGGGLCWDADLCDCQLDAASGHCTSGTLDHASHYFKSDSVYPPPLDGRKLAETSWGGLFDPADKVVAAAFHG